VERRCVFDFQMGSIEPNGNRVVLRHSAQDARAGRRFRGE
jgi:hypothetical protein